MSRTHKIRRLQTLIQRDREDLLAELDELAERVEEHYEAAKMFDSEKGRSGRLNTAIRTAKEAARGPRIGSAEPMVEKGEAVDPELTAKVVEAKEAAAA